MPGRARALDELEKRVRYRRRAARRESRRRRQPCACRCSRSSPGAAAPRDASRDSTPRRCRNRSCARSMAIRSLACAKPPGDGARTRRPCGGSPRSASTFSIPARARSSKSARSSARVAPTHVTCATTVSPICCWICFGERHRSRARRAAGAVGDRHEGRPQRLQRLRSSRRASRAGVVFGRKELERKERPLGRERFADAHRADFLSEAGRDASADERPAVDHDEEQAASPAARRPAGSASSCPSPSASPRPPSRWRRRADRAQSRWQRRCAVRRRRMPERAR